MDEDGVNWIDEEEFKYTTFQESVETGDLGLFLKNIPILLKHLDGLLSHPGKSVAHVPFVGFHVSFKYGEVKKSLPVGCILSEWKKGELLTECPQCHKPLYVYRTVIQYLPGGNRLWKGYCPACEEYYDGTDPDLIDRFTNRMAVALEKWEMRISLTGKRSPQLFDGPPVDLLNIVDRFQKIEADLQRLEGIPLKERMTSAFLKSGMRMAKEAIKEDDVETLNRLSSLGFSLKNPEEGYQLLLQALCKGEVNSINWLLDQKIDPLNDDEGALSMYKAIQSGSAWGVERLLRAGMSARLSIYGKTMLMHAVLNGRKEAAERLLEYGADKNEKGLAERAVAYGDPELVRLITPIGCLFSWKYMKELVLLAIKGRNARVLECLLEGPKRVREDSKKMETMLGWVLTSGDGENEQRQMLKVLFDNGLKVNARVDGKPLLYWCARNKPKLVPFILGTGGLLEEAQDIKDVRRLKAAIWSANMPDRNVRYCGQLQKLQKKFSSGAISLNSKELELLKKFVLKGNITLTKDPQRPGLEIGVIGDWHGSMEALDAFLGEAGFHYTRSCGLARVIRFLDRREMEDFLKSFLEIAKENIVKNRVDKILYY